MAKHNPFSIFRRNQKAWMAGLTLFTMFSFIALGSMLQCVGARNEGTGPRYTDEVAKTSQFGKLDYNDFLNERQEMFRLGAFLDAIAERLEAEGAILRVSSGNLLFLHKLSRSSNWRLVAAYPHGKTQRRKGRPDRGSFGRALATFEWRAARNEIRQPQLRKE